MRFGGRNSVVVEVVDDSACSLGGKRDVELGEESNEGAGHSEGRGRGEEDVALGVDEVEKDLGGQVGAETCAFIVSTGEASKGSRSSRTLDLGGQEEDMIIVPLAKGEQRQLIALGRLVSNVEASL